MYSRVSILYRFWDILRRGMFVSLKSGLVVIQVIENGTMW